MVRSTPTTWAVCIVLGVTAQPVGAGWLSLKNDTKSTVVVQETVTVNGVTRKQKPVKLAPGEVFREFQPNGGKTLTVSEAGIFGKELFSGTICWTCDTEYNIHKTADQVKVTDAATLKTATATVRAQAPTTPPMATPTTPTTAPTAPKKP